MYKQSIQRFQEALTCGKLLRKKNLKRVDIRRKNTPGSFKKGTASGVMSFRVLNDIETDSIPYFRFIEVVFSEKLWKTFLQNVLRRRHLNAGFDRIAGH